MTENSVTVDDTKQTYREIAASALPFSPWWITVFIGLFNYLMAPVAYLDVTEYHWFSPTADAIMFAVLGTLCLTSGLWLVMHE